MSGSLIKRAYVCPLPPLPVLLARGKADTFYATALSGSIQMTTSAMDAAIAAAVTSLTTATSRPMRAPIAMILEFDFCGSEKLGRPVHSLTVLIVSCSCNVSGVGSKLFAKQTDQGSRDALLRQLLTGCYVHVAISTFVYLLDSFVHTESSLIVFIV